MEFQPKSELKSTLNPWQKKHWAFLSARKKELEQKAIEKGYDKLTKQELLEMKEFVLMYKKFIKEKEFSGQCVEAVNHFDFNNFTELINFQIIDDWQEQFAEEHIVSKEIVKKICSDKALTVEELKFIYNVVFHSSDVGGVFEEFSKKLLAKAKSNLAIVFDVEEKNIATKPKEINEETVAAILQEFSSTFFFKNPKMELKDLGRIHLLKAELTSREYPEIEKLEYWRGSISDMSNKYHYNNLKAIGGNMLIANCNEIVSEELLYCGGKMETGRRPHDCVILPKLQMINELNAFGVKEVRMEELRSACFLRFPHVQKIDLPNLKSIGIGIEINKRINDNKVNLPDWVFSSGKIRWT